MKSDDESVFGRLKKDTLSSTRNQEQITRFNVSSLDITLYNHPPSREPCKDIAG